MPVLSSAVRDYLFVTTAYWGFTLTDGALRMLVVLYFYQLGYSPLEVASLFIFYELFGVVTNLFGGWLAARTGIKTTLFSGLALQIIALVLLAQTDYLSLWYVMALQAISGIAKDLNKMSAKTAIKQLVPEDAQSRLFKWVSLLTGSKNALKGAGFFLGGALLASLGFSHALYVLAAGLLCVFALVIVCLKSSLHSKAYKPKFTELFSRSSEINVIALARFFLFSARDVWFVVALPVFLISQNDWQSSTVGALMAAWIILYGVVQSTSPNLLGFKKQAPTAKHAKLAAWGLAATLVVMLSLVLLGVTLVNVVLVGLMLFAVVFAFNSALHSYLVVAYAKAHSASVDVGFYYTANAAGRLFGTVLGGALYGVYGITSTLIASLVLVVCCGLVSFKLPQSQS